MNKLAEKLLNNSKTKLTDVLEQSTFYTDRDIIPTPIPMVNVALSGRVDGGLASGVTVLAGKSKNFKSGFALLFASAYLNKHKDAAMLFYDTEFGMPEGYFDMFSIDKSRVIHTPITDVEELKHDAVNQLKNINRGDRVIIIVDSIGNIASRKEVDDATEGKHVADMSRAKQIKSFFRMVTPHMGIKDIPMVVINHTYETLEMYSQQVMGGGTGPYYSADDIWFIGRQQDKDDKELTGYHFIINVEKSRFVKEKSKIPITISFEKGIQKWAGLFDIALELGFIENPSKGYYNVKGSEDKFRRAVVEYDNKFWTEMFKTPDLSNALEKRYRLSSVDVINTEGE